MPTCSFSHELPVLVVEPSDFLMRCRIGRLLFLSADVRPLRWEDQHGQDTPADGTTGHS
jgi:hypothetical protein